MTFRLIKISALVTVACSGVYSGQFESNVKTQLEKAPIVVIGKIKSLNENYRGGSPSVHMTVEYRAECEIEDILLGDFLKRKSIINVFGAHPIWEIQPLNSDGEYILFLANSTKQLSPEPEINSGNDWACPVRGVFKNNWWNRWRIKRIISRMRIKSSDP